MAQLKPGTTIGGRNIVQELDSHKADIATHGGIYHKNLLHNWDFSIWQRGTSFPSNESGNEVFTADRWKCSWHKGVERIPNTSPHKSLYAIKITTMKIASDGHYIAQRLENLSNLKGATLTLSAYVKASAACVIRLIIKPLDGDARVTSRNVNAGEWQLVTQTITLGSSGINWVRINTGAIAADETIEIGAVKLELGDKSTLANDPPADYGEQLALCQRYFVAVNALRIAYATPAFAIAFSNTIARALLHLPAPMRLGNPTVTMKGSNWVLTQTTSATGLPVTEMKVAFLESAANVGAILLELTSSGLTTGSAYRLEAKADTTCDIWISAE